MVNTAIKKTALALALAGAAFGANATTTVLGAASPGAPLAFSGYAPVGSFVDDFLFSLPANGGSGYSVVNFPLSIPGATFNTLFSTLTLYSDPDGLGFNGDESVLNVVTGTNANSLSMTLGGNAGGSYILSVGGATNGSAGGIYSGAISVTAVPEPATWATMATGVILLGFGLRRMRG